MFKIGNLEIKYRAIPAPMASFSDIAYRKLMDEIGYTGYMITEMISAEGLRRKQDRTLAMIQSFEYRTPQFVQLFGSEPEQLADAAQLIENETTFKGIDINMGCPAPKIVRKQSGSFLLKEPLKVAAIVRAVRKATSLPLTVKIRLGFSQVNVFEIVDILASEGVDAVAVHFRLKSDGYKGQAKWQYAPLLRAHTPMVLIGNGDIIDAETAQACLKNVDAVMIGRGSVRNPLIFAQIAGADPGEHDFHWCINRLVELIIQYYPQKLQLPRLKAFARFLFFGRPGCKRTRQGVYQATSMNEAAQHLKNIPPEELVPLSNTDFSEFE